MAKKGQGYRDVSKYKPEYCTQLIEHMTGGLSYESFAGLIGTSRQALYNWEKAHPEWLYTKKRGLEASLLYWEELGRDIAEGNKKFANAAVWIFTVCNRFKDLYTNKHVHQFQPQDKKEQLQLAYSIDDDASEAG